MRGHKIYNPKSNRIQTKTDSYTIQNRKYKSGSCRMVQIISKLEVLLAESERVTQKYETPN